MHESIQHSAERCPNQACGLIRAESRGRLAAPWSFRSLIHPLSVEEFCSVYWAERPLHLERGDSHYYGDLLTLEEVEDYLSLDEFYSRHSILTITREFRPPGPPPASLGEVHERLLSGKSLRLRRMECFIHPAAPVIRLVRDMELGIGHPKASLSCYLSPPGAPGLGPHHDETEIFTLQISGSKRWQLFHRVDAEHPGICDPAHLGAPTCEIVLQQGDLLYVPRGYVHDVTTTGEPSFSLTIVFAPFKWSTVLDLLVERLAHTSPFIRPLPAGILSGGSLPESFQRELDEHIGLIRRELSTLTVDTLVDVLGARHVSRLTMPPDGQLERLFGLDGISLETRVQRRPGTACHLSRNGGGIVLTLPGGYALEASDHVEPALRQVLATAGPFRVGEMHESLTERERIAIAKRLVSFGLLSLVDGDRSQAP